MGLLVVLKLKVVVKGQISMEKFCTLISSWRKGMVLNGSQGKMSGGVMLMLAGENCNIVNCTHVYNDEP